MEKLCMNISYDSYRIFYYAAKYRSFSQAAAALYNNQPNVTRMERYMRPETLFGTKFEGYLNEARKEAERNGKDNRDSEPHYGVYL